ncbi:hypothetical protein FRC10_005630, partial [Ceratobasidium sp. 414]
IPSSLGPGDLVALGRTCKWLPASSWVNLGLRCGRPENEIRVGSHYALQPYRSL